MTFIRYMGALTVALLLANPTLAQQGQGRQNTQAMQEQRVQELIDTLEITPEQEPEFRAAMAQIRQQQMTAMRENTGQRGQAQGRGQGQRQGQMTREQRQEQMAERREHAQQRRAEAAEGREQAQQRRAEAGERREQAQAMAAQRQEATEEILSEVLTEEQMARFRAQQRR